MDLDLSQFRALHVTPSAISQRLRALEVAAGRILLVRTKPVQVTESGEVVLRLARQVDLLTADVARELGGEPSPERVSTLPIAVKADSMATWVLPALAPLAGDVCFDLHREDQEHTSALLRAGTVMAAVTADADPVPGCTSTRLGGMRYRPMASAAVTLGLGWGMVPDQQARGGTAELVTLDPDAAVDVVLYWQQWRLRSSTLD